VQLEPQAAFGTLLSGRQEVPAPWGSLESLKQEVLDREEALAATGPRCSRTDLRYKLRSAWGNQEPWGPHAWEMQARAPPYHP
jgi:hypothetical protein